MHALAKALRDAGVSAYLLDIRGHGGSGRCGDIDFNADPEFGRHLKNIHRPAAVVVGGADEQVIADQFAPLFQSLDVNIPVTIVPGMMHVDMIATRTALEAVVNAVSPQK